MYEKDLFSRYLLKRYTKMKINKLIIPPLDIVTEAKKKHIIEKKILM
jgi:hypothetical protein|tara:strand:- start:3 stop:143 length:141 start_codon:yes stop_codon:yes gene_type:complete